MGPTRHIMQSPLDIPLKHRGSLILGQHLLVAPFLYHVRTGVLLLFADMVSSIGQKSIPLSPAILGQNIEASLP